MKKALQKASKLIDSHDERHIRKHLRHEDSEVSFYANSVHKKDSVIIAMARDAVSRFLMLFSVRTDGIFARFDGEQLGDSGIYAKKCRLSEANSCIIRELFPWTAPVKALSKGITFGCGDRLGLAAPGHIEALKKFDATPVLAQQSIQELKASGRTYRDVIDDTTFLVYQAGYTGGFGADADHLRNESHINMALAAGVTMLTLDLCDETFPGAAFLSEHGLSAAFGALPSHIQDRILETYSGKTFALPSVSLHFSRHEAMRCAVTYFEAVEFAFLASNLVSASGSAAELEISLDKMPFPLSPESHFFIASELLRMGVEFASLAPRFTGEFMCGMDYEGDPKEFSRQLAVHQDIASHFGSYKLSLHCASDKFKILPAFAKATSGRMHLKTSGSNWLEALSVIAASDPGLFRTLYGKAISGLQSAAKAHTAHADFTKIPLLLSLSDRELPKLLSIPEARLMLHIAYEPMMEDIPSRKAIFAAIHKDEELFHERIMSLTKRHLSCLGLAKVKTSRRRPSAK